LADEPMVFAIYGRGRALEPYVGKGITADNLAEIVMFVADACSCMVKDMNPGSDLLMKWDWDQTAEVLAADDPSLDMSGYYGYGEYPAGGMEEEPAEVEAEPEAVAAVEDAVGMADSAPAETAEAPQAAEPSDTAPEPDAAEVAVAAGEEPAESQPEATTAEPEAEAAAAPERVESDSEEAAHAAAPAGPSGSAASGRLWTYGLGLLIGAVVVIGAGFVLLRKQSGG